MWRSTSQRRLSNLSPEMGRKWSHSVPRLWKPSAVPEPTRGRIQEERYRPSGQHRKGKRIPQTWMDHRRTQRVFREGKHLSPRHVILGRQPSLSRRSVFPAAPERRVEVSAREPRICDLTGLQQLFLLVPGVVPDAPGSLAAFLLTDSPAPPSRFTSLGSSILVSVSSSPWDGLLVCSPHFSSWKVKGNHFVNEHCFSLPSDSVRAEMHSFMASLSINVSTRWASEKAVEWALLWPRREETFQNQYRCLIPPVLTFSVLARLSASLPLRPPIHVESTVGFPEARASEKYRP